MSHEVGGTTLGGPAGNAPSGVRRESVAPLPALTVLSHPDLSRIGDRAFLGELARGRTALLSRQQPRFAAPGAAVGEPLADPFLSRQPLEIVPLAGGSVRVHRAGSPTRLAVDGLPVEESHAIPGEALDDHGAVLELADRIVLLLHRRPPPVPGLPERFGLIGESATMEAVRQAIARVAPLDTPVIVRGETGTGKELVARALHEHGPRAGHPFVGVNLAALPLSLAAAELFGAVRGAYTGAVRDTPGYFASAHGGTLFLDEIGEAPPEVQVLLLRVLETGEVVPVGGQSPRRVDARIVSATDVDLEAALRSGSFRSALLHRLAGYAIRLPSLRRRREDLGRLLVHFLGREMERLGERLPQGDPAPPEPWLPSGLVVRLALYDWPGNVRELANLARQIVIDSRGEPLLRLDAGLAERIPAPPAPQAPAASRPRWGRRPSDITDDELLAALREHRWNLRATAEALGVARTSLYSLLDRSPRVRSASDVPSEEIRLCHARCGGDLPAMVAELEVSERGLRQRLKDLGLR